MYADRMAQNTVVLTQVFEIWREAKRKYKKGDKVSRENLKDYWFDLEFYQGL